MAALGGTLWLSGDDLPSLAAQGRLGYLTDPEVLDVVRSGRAGIPIGLADRLRGPAAVWLAPQSDGSAVVALFNWGNHAQTVAVPLAAIGLRARTYTVRDLWARASLPGALGCCGRAVAGCAAVRSCKQTARLRSCVHCGTADPGPRCALATGQPLVLP